MGKQERIEELELQLSDALSDVEDLTEQVDALECEVVAVKVAAFDLLASVVEE